MMFLLFVLFLVIEMSSHRKILMKASLFPVSPWSLHAFIHYTTMSERKRRECYL